MQAGVDRCCARSMCAVFIGARMVLTYGWMATAARGERVAVEWDDMAHMAPFHTLTKYRVIPAPLSAFYQTSRHPPAQYKVTIRGWRFTGHA